jgi:hypothetical protein
MAPTGHPYGFGNPTPDTRPEESVVNPPENALSFVLNI